MLLYNIRFYSHYKQQGTQMLNSTFNVYIFLRHGLLHIGHNAGHLPLGFITFLVV